jgi:hypothetical protein
MKAKHAGTCMSCRQGIQVGAEIGRLLGKYVHQACKDRELAELRSQGSVEALPEHVTNARRAAQRQNIRPHVGHTRGIRKVT